MVEAYLEILDLGYFEVTEAFRDLADENVWKRPAEGLLSIGELAGHIAYAEALRFACKPGENGEMDLTNCAVSSSLIDPRFWYYPITLENPPSEQQMAMTAEEVCRELVRVHQESVACFKALDPDLESMAPGQPANFTYGEWLRYAAFHVAYHTGQMYSARHLLEEVPPDN